METIFRSTILHVPKHTCLYNCEKHSFYTFMVYLSKLIEDNLTERRRGGNTVYVADHKKTQFYD